MTPVVRPRATPSPCIQTCRMDAVTNLCVGCGRTLPEIANWGSMSDAERAMVRAQLPSRMATVKTAQAAGTAGE